MSITALDIQQQGFEHSMRGYNVDQVDVFLERVAQEVDLMTREIEQLKAAAAAAQKKAAAQPEPESVEYASDEDLEVALDRAEEAEASLAAMQEKNAELSEQLSAAQARVRTAEETARAADGRYIAANDKIAELERRVSEKGDTDTAIANAFISAQRAADNLKEEARAEGERIYRESEAKAREFIREALIEKQRILNEIDALTISCERFRSEYRAMLDHYSAEAEHLTDIKAPVVTESAVDAVLPDINTISTGAIDDISTEDVSTAAALADDDFDIEEVD